MEAIASIANGFMDLFRAGSDTKREISYDNHGLGKCRLKFSRRPRSEFYNHF